MAFRSNASSLGWMYSSCSMIGVRILSQDLITNDAETWCDSTIGTVVWVVSAGLSGPEPMSAASPAFTLGMFTFIVWPISPPSAL